jgi:hypothetical protein
MGTSGRKAVRGIVHNSIGGALVAPATSIV